MATLTIPPAHGDIRQLFGGRALAAICADRLAAVDEAINGVPRGELDEAEAIERITGHALIEPVTLADRSEWAISAGLRAGGADIAVSIPFTGSEELIDAGSITNFLGNAPDAPRGTVIDSGNGHLKIGLAARVENPVNPQSVALAVTSAVAGLRLRLDNHADTLRGFAQEVNEHTEQSREARRRLLSMADEALQSL
jgi:hypothetical protein